MSRSAVVAEMVTELLEESWATAAEAEDLTAFLESLVVLGGADAPSPSDELTVLLAGWRAPTSDQRRIRPIKGNRPVGSTRRAVVGASALALAAAVTTGAAAAANELPDPIQRMVAELSERYLPFDIPRPDGDPSRGGSTGADTQVGGAGPWESGPAGSGAAGSSQGESGQAESGPGAARPDPNVGQQPTNGHSETSPTESRDAAGDGQSATAPQGPGKADGTDEDDDAGGPGSGKPAASDKGKSDNGEHAQADRDGPDVVAEGHHADDTSAGPSAGGEPDASHAAAPDGPPRTYRTAATAR